MKKILQALDGTPSKPVEGSPDMKKFLQVVTEGANPHKVTLPVQMAMNHYQQPKTVEQVKEVKKPNLSSKLYQYYEAAEQQFAESEIERKEIISEQARAIAERVKNKSLKNSNPCWKGYHPVGTKKKDGKTVPNCVPTNEDLNMVGDENLKDVDPPQTTGEEGSFVKNQLHTIKRVVTHLEHAVGEEEDLPEWVQMKISQAQEMLVGLMDFMISDKERDIERQNGEDHMMSEIGHMRNPDTMNPHDYDRYQQDQMDYEKRDFKRREIEHELSHEDHGQYYVVMAKHGKWEKTKAQPRPGMDNAFNLVKRLHAKYPSMHLGVYDPFMKTVHNMGKKA